MKKYIIALLGFIPFLGFSQEIHPCGQVHAMDDFFKSHPEERAIAAAAKIELEELRFISISDYTYEIKNPKISIFDNCAIVALELVQKGMLVDNKAFTGEHMVINGRATFVLVKESTWKIVHIHLSKIDK